MFIPPRGSPGAANLAADNVYNIYDQCELANDNAKIHSFREWEELLGGDRDAFTAFDPLSSSPGAAGAAAPGGDPAAGDSGGSTDFG